MCIRDRFVIGSLSKSFTAFAVMQLVEAGRVDLDGPVARYVPGFRLADADAVWALLARMDAEGVPILERWDEPGYVAFKFLDPDGWRVEAYWEPIGHSPIL